LKVSAVILSGGRATRLNGEDKGLCLYQNKPLIRHVLEALECQVSDIVISANRYLETYEMLGYKVVEDGNDEFEGPLKGLSKALPYCKQSKVLVTTCDMPFIPSTLLTLFDEISTAPLQVISVKQRMQLCFLMDVNLQQSLNDYLKDGGNRVMQWIKSNEYYNIEYLGDPIHFKNLNTPEDFLMAPGLNTAN